MPQVDSAACQHGTLVAGILSADAVGAPGISPAARSSYPIFETAAGRDVPTASRRAPRAIVLRRCRSPGRQRERSSPVHRNDAESQITDHAARLGTIVTGGRERCQRRQLSDHATGGRSPSWRLTTTASAPGSNLGGSSGGEAEAPGLNVTSSAAGGTETITVQCFRTVRHQHGRAAGRSSIMHAQSRVGGQANRRRGPAAGRWFACRCPGTDRHWRTECPVPARA